jgi:hypothetical protein
MKIRNFSILVFLLLSNTLVAQKLFSEKFDNCSPTFSLEKDQIRITYEKSDSLLVNKIVNGIENKHFIKLRGVIAAQLVIDSAGTACLNSYDYKFNMLRKPFDIEENLKNIKGFEGTGTKDFISVLFKIFFENKTVTFRRLGYSRNTGWSVLSESTFKKPEEEK